MWRRAAAHRAARVQGGQRLAMRCCGLECGADVLAQCCNTSRHGPDCLHGVAVTLRRWACLNGLVKG